MTQEEKTARQDGGVRERLLAAALGLFNSKGYAAASVREIVEASGVTKPVLYYYFGNKEGLYLELMNGPLAEFESSLKRVTAFQGGVTERILHFCLTILELVRENVEVARLVYAIYYGPPQGAPHIDFNTLFDRMVESIGEMVREGAENGELRPDAGQDGAWAVISILNTAMEEQFCHTPPRIDGPQMERMLRLLMEGLAAKTA